MQYLVAAYAVMWVLVVLYVISIGMRTSRLAREVELMNRLMAEKDAGDPAP